MIRWSTSHTNWWSIICPSRESRWVQIQPCTWHNGKVGDHPQTPSLGQCLSWPSQGWYSTCSSDTCPPSVWHHTSYLFCSLVFFSTSPPTIHSPASSPTPCSYPHTYSFPSPTSTQWNLSSTNSTPPSLYSLSTHWLTNFTHIVSDFKYSSHSC
jgi:hypothetical protein